MNLKVFFNIATLAVQRSISQEGLVSILMYFDAYNLTGCHAGSKDQFTLSKESALESDCSMSENYIFQGDENTPFSSWPEVGLPTLHFLSLEFSFFQVD